MEFRGCREVVGIVISCNSCMAGVDMSHVGRWRVVVSTMKWVINDHVCTNVWLAEAKGC